MNINNDMLKGIVRVRVKGQRGLSPGQQSILRAALNNGIGGTPELRFKCRIAQDTNEAFEAAAVPGYVLNPACKAQFGRNAHKQAFLTVGVIDQNGVKYTLRWLDQNVPKRMKEIAVAHDEGRDVPPETIALNLAAAEVLRVGDRHDGNRRDRTRKDPRKGHSKDRNGNPYPSKATARFDRLCAADLK